MEIALPVILLLLLLFLGIPIAFSLAVSGILGIYLVTGNATLATSFLGTAPYSAVASYTLTALPMFILLAYILSVSRMSDDLYGAAASWLSGRKGGLAYATLAASGVFGAMSGSTVAAASAIGTMTVPNMVKHGYSQVMASSVAALGATLAVLIPPSVLMIIYGAMTETSIAALFVAGIVPGLLLIVLLAAAVRIWVVVQPSAAPETFTVPIRERFGSTTALWPVLTILAAIMVALYSGFSTPTETAAVGAVLAILVTAVMRRLSRANMIVAMNRTLSTTSMILLIIVGGTVFGRYLALTGLPQEISAWIGSLDINRYWVIIGIVVMYFILSMVMDEVPILLLTIPFTYPIIVDLGFDPIWFGVLTMMMVIMGLTFPPVGLVVFVVSAATGVPSGTIFRGTSILLLPVAVTTGLIIVFPEIALWLPSTR